MGEKQKVLAIDDETDMLLLVSAALRAEGYDVVTAANGPDGLELALSEQPDAIILDVMMPHMSGLEVLEKLRTDPATMAIPVIMLTGLSDKANIQSAIDLGTNFYIVKPFEVPDLLGKVKMVIKEAGMGPAPGFDLGGDL